MRECKLLYVECHARGVDHAPQACAAAVLDERACGMQLAQKSILSVKFHTCGNYLRYHTCMSLCTHVLSSLPTPPRRPLDLVACRVAEKSGIHHDSFVMTNPVGSRGKVYPLAAPGSILARRREPSGKLPASSAAS